MKLRAALAVTATILAGAVGGLSGCALPTGMAGLGSGAGTGLTGTQVADTECHPQLDLAETASDCGQPLRKSPSRAAVTSFISRYRTITSIPAPTSAG